MLKDDASASVSLRLCLAGIQKPSRATGEANKRGCATRIRAQALGTKPFIVILVGHMQHHSTALTSTEG